MFLSSQEDGFINIQMSVANISWRLKTGTNIAGMVAKSFIASKPTSLIVQVLSHTHPSCSTILV